MGGQEVDDLIVGDAAGTALIAKMLRVFMMAPFLVGLALWLLVRGSGQGTARRD